MLSAHRATVLALAVALGFQVASCASDAQHAPFASATCETPPCAVGAVVGRSPGNGEVDSGASTPDSSASQVIICHTDPTLLIRLCSGSPACVGQQPFIDPVKFANCGFLGTGVDVECVCNGASLCPVAVQTSCSYVATQLSLKSYDDICAPALTGGCVDASSLPRGTGGAGGGLGAGGSP